jgi:hypothetical protein
MRSDVDLMGVFFSSSFIYLMVAIPLFIVLRNVLFRIGFYKFVWHPNLFELALYSVIISLLVLAVPI